MKLRDLLDHAVCVPHTVDAAVDVVHIFCLNIVGHIYPLSAASFLAKVRAYAVRTADNAALDPTVYAPKSADPVKSIKTVSS